MKIKIIKVKSIITKSGLPDTDFVINPYVGCQHGCIYCYARFMKKFTNHSEPWGKFLDVKINAADLIPKNTQKYENKSIFISSVTDPYQPIERKYKLTREILKNLISFQPNLCVMTKSDLIIRDIDLLKKFKNCIAGISLSLIDDNLRKEVEPFASSVEKRINALKQLKKAKIKTFIFISPMFPELSHSSSSEPAPWKKIIEKTKNWVDKYWFENLNLYSTLRNNIFQWLKNHHSELVKKYQKIYFTKNNYWNFIEKEIENYCHKNNLNFKIYFHHQRTFG
jgi:DNA repair photolyase